jgi:hypothetical protein
MEVGMNWKWFWFLMDMRLKVIYWLDDHTPVFCSDCKALRFEKDMTYEKTFAGHDTPLCETCHAKWFPE